MSTPPSPDNVARPLLADAQDAMANYMDGLLEEEGSPSAEPFNILSPSEPASESGMDSRIETATNVLVGDSTHSVPGAHDPVIRAPMAVELQTPAFIGGSRNGFGDAVEFWPDNVPYWVSDPFQCLLFEFSGLRLAVPTLKLSGVIPAPKAWQGDPSCAPWCLGRVEHEGQIIRVVDIGRIVVPPGRRYRPIEAERIILFAKGRWGIACDGEMRMVTLRPGEVNWRSDEGRRGWLGGTVRSIGCAILDLDGLLRDFERRLQSR